MKIDLVSIRNFRRLEDVTIGIEVDDTVFVGPNNSGKTSATAIFKCFLGKRDFTIHDFTVSRISDFDSFEECEGAIPLPKIELDIWFKIDPESIAFGRAFTLLPNLTDSFDRLGIRLSYQAQEPQQVVKAYSDACPSVNGRQRAKRLSEYLAQDGILKAHYRITYASLHDGPRGLVSTPLDVNEGKSLLQNLIRVDFVEAQRNIDDEEGYRSNRLSNAFARFYRKNLERAEASMDANRVIDENNQLLTQHYERQFGGLIKMINGLGVPSINDRNLRIVSSLDAETALKGSTDLLYVDTERGHHLPELYNGLGFKNLIFMAIQAKDFHAQWARTEVNRPMCQIIFIEEPEVHLHMQVQQTFIRNIREVISTSAKDEGAESLLPQLVVTTHSSHILDATDFAKVRYFRRCMLRGEETSQAIVLNATQVHSLRDFMSKDLVISGKDSDAKAALLFLKRYLRLTHCDIFFSDAVILVEGSVEKLLIPAMIDKVARKLRSSYLTVLEIGGAYAHQFEALLSFIHVPYLIVTDLDSVSSVGQHKVCRADEEGALTSNASLKKLFKVKSVKELMALTEAQKEGETGSRYVTFSRDVTVEEMGKSKVMRPRTIEESFLYQNFSHLRSGVFKLPIDVPEELEQAYDAIFQHVQSGSFKKTDFALMLLTSAVDWVVPNYIEDGLVWLERRLHGPQEEALKLK